jgi:hypothetical protein
MPDNGLITMILGKFPDEVVAIPFPPGFKKNIRNFTSLLVEAFSSLLSGVKLEKLGKSSVSIQEKHLMKPFSSDQYIEGQILMIDRFLNVIVNITPVPHLLIRYTKLSS